MRRYIKLETMWDASGWLDILSAEAQLCWIKLLCYVKGHGWDGRVKAISPITASRMWNVGEESVRQFLKAAELHGALKVADQEWIIAKWQEYQGDATGAQRKAKYDQKHRTPDSNNGGNALPSVTNADKDKDRDTINPPTPPKGGKREALISIFDLLPESHRTDSIRLAYAEYEAMRTECRMRPWKETTIKARAKQWAAFHPSQVAAALRKSVANQWQGVFPENEAIEGGGSDDLPVTFIPPKIGPDGRAVYAEYD